MKADVWIIGIECHCQLQDSSGFRRFEHNTQDHLCENQTGSVKHSMFAHTFTVDRVLAHFVDVFDRGFHILVEGALLLAGVMSGHVAVDAVYKLMPFAVKEQVIVMFLSLLFQLNVMRMGIKKLFHLIKEFAPRYVKNIIMYSFVGPSFSWSLWR